MTRYFCNDDDVERLAQEVIGCTCPKAEWTHAAHFAVAFWVLRHRPDRQAEVYLPGVIRAYNEASGVRNTDASGYHETITHASIWAARRFLRGYGGEEPLHELIDLVMETPFGDSQWVLSHWSRERLFSVGARRDWAEPDLQPLD